MPSPSWYNENEARAYPFAATSADLPPAALVVDAGFVAYADSRFHADANSVRLTTVRRRGDYFYLDFVSDAPELFGVDLTFTRHAAGPDFLVEFSDSGTAGLSESSQSASRPGACDEPLWSGFVVTGRMAAFAALLPADGDAAVDATVEPALVQNLAEAYVAKLGVANLDRTRVDPPAGCDGDTPAADVVFTNRDCVVGDVVLVPGYNASVRQNGSDNSVTLGAAVGDGAGEPCAPVPLYPGESPPTGSDLLGGGPRCNQTVRSVNGVGGPLLNLTAGRGVTVTSVPDENKVVVTVDMTGLAICFDAVSAVSESC